MYVLVFLLMIISCGKKESSAKTDNSTANSDSSREESISNTEAGKVKEWANETGMGWSLSLKSDNTFTSMLHAPGGSDFSGTWKKEGNQLVLKPDSGMPDYISLWGDGKLPASGVYKCTEKDDKTSLFYNRKLDCGVQSFWDPDSKKAGESHKYKGIDLTLIHKYGAATTSLMFRSAPNAQANAYSCIMYEKKVGALPEGTTFTVIGRTNEKVKVNKWENYWYLIELIMDEGFNCDAERGWVFAEFVEFE